MRWYVYIWNVVRVFELRIGGRNYERAVLEEVYSTEGEIRGNDGVSHSDDELGGMMCRCRPRGCLY